MGPECYSCNIFAAFDAMAMTYARDAFAALSPRASAIFNAFVGVWVAWQLGYRGIVKADLNIQEFVTQAAIFMLCGGAITSIDLYWEWIYDTTYVEMNTMAVAIVKGAPDAGAVESIKGMLAVIEREILRVLDLAAHFMRNAGISNGYNLGPIVATLLLSLPFIFVWGIFLAFLLEGLFKLLAVTAVAPLLIAAMAFKPTRGFAISGLRIVLGGFLTVLFAAVAMGFTVAILRREFAHLPIDGTTITGDIDKWLLGPGYWGVFILGFVSVLFHLKAATLAANISGAHDGPGAAASVVGAGMAAVGTLKAATMRAAGKLPGAADVLGKQAAATRDRIWSGAKANMKGGGSP